MRPNAQADTFLSHILAGSCCIATPSLSDRQFPPNAQRAAKTYRQPDCEHPTRHYPRKPSFNDADRHNILAGPNLSGVISEYSSHYSKCHQLMKSAADETENPPPTGPEDHDWDPAARIGSTCVGEIDPSTYELRRYFTDSVWPWTE